MVFYYSCFLFVSRLELRLARLRRRDGAHRGKPGRVAQVAGSRATLRPVARPGPAESRAARRARAAGSGEGCAGRRHARPGPCPRRLPQRSAAGRHQARPPDWPCRATRVSWEMWTGYLDLLKQLTVVGDVTNETFIGALFFAGCLLKSKCECWVLVLWRFRCRGCSVNHAASLYSLHAGRYEEIKANPDYVIKVIEGAQRILAFPRSLESLEEIH